MGRTGKILLCDDDLMFMNKLEVMVGQQYPEKVNITKITDITTCLNEEYDICFLDIEMPMMSGFELAKRIHDKYPKSLIVFLTSHEELSMEGYEYHAFRFISKQRLDVMLPKTLSAIHKHMCAGNEHLIVKDQADLAISLSLGNVRMIISEGNYLTLHDKSACYKKRMTLKSFHDLFSTEDFLFAQRAVLVNLNHIDKVDLVSGELILDNGYKLKISRKYKADFTDGYIKYKNLL